MRRGCDSTRISAPFIEIKKEKGGAGCRKMKRIAKKMGKIKRRKGENGHEIESEKGIEIEERGNSQGM